MGSPRTTGFNSWHFKITRGLKHALFGAAYGLAQGYASSSIGQKGSYGVNDDITVLCTLANTLTCSIGGFISGYHWDDLMAWANHGVPVMHQSFNRKLYAYTAAYFVPPIASATAAVIYNQFGEISQNYTPARIAAAHLLGTLVVNSPFLAIDTGIQCFNGDFVYTSRPVTFMLSGNKEERSPLLPLDMPNSQRILALSIPTSSTDSEPPFPNPSPKSLFPIKEDAAGEDEEVAAEEEKADKKTFAEKANADGNGEADNPVISSYSPPSALQKIGYFACGDTRPVNPPIADTEFGLVISYG